MKAERPDRIAKLLDAATEGLAGDAELARDVRAELATHIEEKRHELSAKGHNDNEALDLALKSFGPPTDLAAELVEANRRRMKLRALARLGIRAGLVPAAVVVAALVCGGLVFRVVNGWGTVAVLSRYGWDAFPGIDVDRSIARLGLSDDSRLILFGDWKRPTDAARQRAIWEAHPESKVFYGNYVTSLACDERDLAVLEREIRRGMELDPRNARYDYLLAGLMLGEACEVQYPPQSIISAEAASEEMLLMVKDRELLDRAMAVYFKAREKPHFKMYSREMLALRLSLLPPSRRIEEQYGKINMAAGVQFPDLAQHRQLARVAPLYAELLISEGRAAEARGMLDGWYPLVTKSSSDAHFLVEFLVSGAVLRIVKARFATAYEKLGDQGAADRTRKLAGRLAKPIDTWQGTWNEHRGSDDGAERERRIARSGSAIAGIQSIYDPATVDEIDLRAGRETEHAVMEQAGQAAMLVLLFVLMFGAVVATLRWRWVRGMRSAPLLLLPSWREAARILALGVLAPLAAFHVYTRCSGLAGREFSLTFLFPRFLLELCLLAATISFLTVSLAGRFVRRRCLTLGIKTPRQPGRGRRIAVLSVLGTLWAVCLFLRDRDVAIWAAAPVGIAGAVVLLCAAVIAMMRLLFGPREHGLFIGTVARSLVPVFAAAAILIGAVAHPYLTRQETDLVQRDPILTLDKELLVNKPEADLVRRLKAEIKQAILEIDGEIEAEKAGTSPRGGEPGNADTR